jgi:hypothetical protein
VKPASASSVESTLAAAMPKVFETDKTIENIGKFV